MSETVRVQALGGKWETLGADRFRGISAENLILSADEWGPAQCTFAIKAEPGAQRPDLLPYAPVEVEIDGILCWTGRVAARPVAEREHQVQCEGWQFHLDDDQGDRVYVHTRLSDYRDHRSFLTADLTVWTSGWQIESGDGVIAITLPNGAVSLNGLAGGVTLDLGPSSTARRVVVTLRGGGRANFNVQLRAGDIETHTSDETFTLATTAPTGDTTYAQTLAADRRYIRFLMNNNTGGSATGDDTSWVRLAAVKVFRSTAYESGNASILEADEVIRDVLGAAPLLNQATTLIADATFAIPEYVTDGSVTPRQVIEQVNAYENYLHRIAGADLKTLDYRPKPSAPLFEVGSWSGSEFADASVSGESIYDKVIVEGTGPDGAQVVVVRTQTGTLVDRRGGHRTLKFSPRSAITQLVGERFGDLLLAEHRTAPFSGKLNVTGDGVRRIKGGTPIPPHQLLLHVGEKIRLSHRIDPDTGAIGRDGRIAAVTYRHGERVADIDIDDRREHFAGVLARYGVLTDQTS